MNKTNVILKPIHYACVSGGKDSFYMLNLILNNLDKYPLDMVVHFELDVDWPWVKRVIDFMEKRCQAAGIKFIRIKPRIDWNELYEKYDVPTRTVRWCNNMYKLDCKKQLNEWIASQNGRPVAYIGLCADEQQRFKYDVGDWENQDVCYPLAEEGINESVILRWARRIDLFEGWYKVFKRQGCMLCPCLSRMELAYLYKYYPEQYQDWMDKIRQYEIKFETYYFTGQSADKVDYLIKNKWLKKLDYKEENPHYQLQFEFIKSGVNIV